MTEPAPATPRPARRFPRWVARLGRSGVPEAIVGLFAGWWIMRRQEERYERQIMADAEAQEEALIAEAGERVESVLEGASRQSPAK